MMHKTVAHTSLYYYKLSENWIHTQVKHLKGWNSLVLTNETKNLENIDWQPKIYERRHVLPVGLRELDSIMMKLVGFYPSFYYKAKKAGVKLIHAHFGPMGFLSLGIAQKLEIPLVTTFYGYDASELPRQYPSWQEDYKVLFAHGSRFLVEGPAMGAKLEKLGCPPDKITVQHLGIETGKYRVRPSLADRETRFLMAGRFVEKKGFLYGLRAFHKFLQQGGEGTLTLIGDHNGTKASKQIKKEMQDFVQKHQMQETVTFKGLIPLEVLQEEYYKHDVFVAPSVKAQNGDDEGGLPVTVIEAAASGMALIGSRHCDIPEVIRQEETGLLTEEKDDDQLTSHMHLLAENLELVEAMGKAAADLIYREYNAEIQGVKLGKIYDALL